MRILIDKDLRIRMRDGVTLATDVYRPESREPLATLVQRTPYDKSAPGSINNSVEILRAVAEGYAVVVQDVRGRFASEGSFTPFVNEAFDGADTLEWVTAQPWCSGQTGMVGSSYVGATQWLAASTSPDCLGAIAPMATGDDYYDGWTYRGGAFQLGFSLFWALSFLGLGESQRLVTARRMPIDKLDELVRSIDRIDEIFERLPLRDVASETAWAPYYLDWLAHPEYDEYWRRIAPKESYERVLAPAFNIGGWYDLFLHGTLTNYEGMRKSGGSDRARSLQRLMIGPWAHGVYGGSFAARSFGVRGSTDGADVTGAQLRWFDYCLRGIDNGADRDPPVRLFVMGANHWRDLDEWPPPDSEPVHLYLHSRGRANSRTGDGVLSPDAPGSEAPDRYTFDPSRPVPTVGGGTFLPGLRIGANSGPRDQASIELRDDVLCYSTSPLSVPLEAVGPVEVVLHVSSSAYDTDFTAKLVDVDPSGHAINVADGVVRLRYRESFAERRLIEPGVIYQIRVDLAGTAYVFDVGHRIRLEVSSSNFPKYDRNPNNGGIVAEASRNDFMVAHNSVHHAVGTPSYLVLPVSAAQRFAIEALGSKD